MRRWHALERENDRTDPRALAEHFLCDNGAAHIRPCIAVWPSDMHFNGYFAEFILVE